METFALFSSRLLVSMEIIHWPDESKILPYKQKPRVLHQIEKLFYNAGVTVSLLYLALKLVIQPTLERHFDQRIQLSSECLLHLRRFVSLLTKKIKATPISAIGFNEHKIQGTSVCYVEPVSYTHLDVYKRQSLVISKYPGIFSWEFLVGCTYTLDLQNSKLVDILYGCRLFCDCYDSVKSPLFNTRLKCGNMYFSL